MITCQQARHLFDAFLDDELSPAMRAEVHAHRLCCPQCSQELALLEACADVVRTDPRQPRVATDFTDRVLTALETRRNVHVYPWRRVATIGGPALAAAAAIAMFFTTSVITSESPTRTKNEVTAGLQQRMPEIIVKDIAPKSLDLMPPTEKKEFEQTEEVPVAAVLEAMLRPVVDRTNATLAQTRQNTSGFYGLFRGMVPADTLLLIGDQIEADIEQNSPPDEAGANASQGPWFDMVDPAEAPTNDVEKAQPTDETVDIF